MKFFVKKIMTLLLTLFLVSFLTFFAFQIVSGDSATAMLGTSATPEAIEALREEMGLNDPILLQYVRWGTGVLQGDFGVSTQYQIEVEELLTERLPITLWLAALSIVMILCISLPLGIFIANSKGKFIDGVITFFLHVSMAIPPFFLGILITLLFGFVLKWFTPGGFVAPEEDFIEFIIYLIFPALAIAIPKIAMVIKFLKNSIVRELRLDYVKTAKSKGNQNTRILYIHVLKNAMIPVITFLAMVMIDVLAGSIIIEQVFGIPGIGRLLVTAISNRDFPVVQIIILYIATMVVFINFLVDLLYQWMDPRVKL